MELENLTQLQKTAIEGEIAKAYFPARHNAEILYRLYTMLKSAPKDVTPFVIQVTKDLVDIKEELIEKTILETLAEEPPLWLWIDKTIADIKVSLKFAMADGMIGDAELNKKVMQQKIVRSAFIAFVRKIAMACTKAARSLCRYIIDEEPIELDFLEDVCFSLIAEIDELEPTEQMTDAVFHAEFDVRNMLSFRIEKEVMEKRDKREEDERSIKKQAKEINEKMDKVIDEALVMPVSEVHNDAADATVYAVKMTANDGSYMAEAVNKVLQKIINEQFNSEKAMKAKESKYAVIKEYANSPVSTTLKAFSTEAEAKSYKEKLESSFPELMKSCTLKVKKVN